MIAADPVLHQFDLSGVSDQQDLRALASIAAQHPPAAAVLRQTLTEAEVPLEDWPDGLSQPGSLSPGYVKDNPNCRAEVLLVGNVELRPFAERNDFPHHPQAGGELTVNTYVREQFLGTKFTDLSLTLEIVSPTGVQFVEHHGRDSFQWSTVEGESWVESSPGRPTTRLRIRDEVVSVNRPGDGVTHRVGVHGLQPGAGLTIRAVATARQGEAPTSSCALQIHDLHVGDRIDGLME